MITKNAIKTLGVISTQGVLWRISKPKITGVPQQIREHPCSNRALCRLRPSNKTIYFGIEKLSAGQHEYN